MKCKCITGIECNDGANFYKGTWYDCEKKTWGYTVTDANGNNHNFTSAYFHMYFVWK